MAKRVPVAAPSQEGAGKVGSAKQLVNLTGGALQNSSSSRLQDQEDEAKKAPTRRVFIDLGANWANTLRLYQDIGGTFAHQHPWEIYAFEASPFIQPYLERFSAHLNGQGPAPAITVPPSGSSDHLNKFAPRYGCPQVIYRDGTVQMWNEMRQCMFNVFKEELAQLHADPALKDASLIQGRLNMATQPVVGGQQDRFVMVPAAAGASAGTLNLGMMTPEQMIRGGAISSPVPGTPSVMVPMVNVVDFIINNFQYSDYVVVKMDIEGAEFSILDQLMDRGHGCKIDVLAMECHSNAGNCVALKNRLASHTCMTKLVEGQGYQAWDHYSSPDLYYAQDPRV